MSVQKYSTESMSPMGMERWNPTSCSWSAVYLGIIKLMEGAYSGLTHICIYASVKSNLYRYAGTSVEYAAIIQYSRRWRAFQKRITSLWDSALAILLSSLHKKS